METGTEPYFLEDGEPKYDIRDWAPNHEKMGKGISLSAEELDELKNLLNV